MRTLFFFCIVFLVSCKNDKEQKSVQETTSKKDSATVVSNAPPEPKKVEEQLPIVDTGQTWFRVKITRNDSAYLDFEGSWPVFFYHGNSGTLQFSKAKGLMTISPGVSFYMNGMPTGKAPVVLSNTDKGTVAMIFMPVVDEAYGLAVSADDGFFNITKNVNSVVNGNFEAKAVDLDKNNFLFKGYFINTKINPEKI